MSRLLFQSSLKSATTDDKKVFLSSVKNTRVSTNRRSKEYQNLISKLDSNLVTTHEGLEKLIHDIQSELQLPGLCDMPLGIVAKCYLGHPFEVHTLDLTGASIIRHYRLNERLPGEFEKARSLARHSDYLFIEVYQNRIVCVRPDGQSVDIPDINNHK